MPINDPIRNRKVAPASLAFDPSRRSSTAVAYEAGTVPANVTYQTNLIVNSTAFFAVEFSDSILAQAQREVMNGVANAELRSKAAIGDYHRAFMWTSDDSPLFVIKANNAFGALTAIQAPTEVLTADGCRIAPSSPAPNTRFQFRCPDGSEGVWWMYCHVEMRILKVNKVQIGRLAIYKNGALWSVVDVVNSDHYKHVDIPIIVLGGGVHVPLQPGDYVEWFIALSATTPGGFLIADGTSYFAVVNGHRESCEYREVNAPTTGANFNAST